MLNLSREWNITLLAVVIFVVVSLPMTYNLVDGLLGGIVGPIAFGGCPTTTGLVLHTIVFALLTRYSMDLNLV